MFKTGRHHFLTAIGATLSVLLCAMTLASLCGSSMAFFPHPFHVTNFLNDQFFVLRVPVDLAQQEVDQRISEMPKETLHGADTAATGETVTEETSDKTSRKDPTRSSLKWIGMESERGWIWIYLEMYPPRLEAAKSSRDWLVHQLFLETVERQENSVVIYPQPRTTSAKKYSLQFKKGQPSALMQARD